MTKVRRPPVLGVGHHGRQILLQRRIVQALEGLSIVEVLLQRVGDCGVLAQDVELQLVGPPVLVAGTATCNVGVVDGALVGAHCADRSVCD